MKSAPLLHSIFVFLAITMLMGCDCTLTVSGVVLNLYTNDPVAGAVISGNGTNTGSVTTDSTGTFEFIEVSGLSNCESVQMKVLAQGYGQQIIEISNGSHQEIRLDTIQ